MAPHFSVHIENNFGAIETFFTILNEEINFESSGRLLKRVIFFPFPLTFHYTLIIHVRSSYNRTKICSTVAGIKQIIHDVWLAAGRHLR